jgi:hypothetical protein
MYAVVPLVQNGSKSIQYRSVSLAIEAPYRHAQPSSRTDLNDSFDMIVVRMVKRR